MTMRSINAVVRSDDERLMAGRLMPRLSLAAITSPTPLGPNVSGLRADAAQITWRSCGDGLVPEDRSAGRRRGGGHRPPAAALTHSRTNQEPVDSSGGGTCQFS